jgi:hypothetical protein
MTDYTRTHTRTVDTHVRSHTHTHKRKHKHTHTNTLAQSLCLPCPPSDPPLSLSSTNTHTHNHAQSRTDTRALQTPPSPNCAAHHTRATPHRSTHTTPQPQGQGVATTKWSNYLAQPKLRSFKAHTVYVYLPPRPHVPGPAQYYEFLGWLQRHEARRAVRAARRARARTGGVRRRRGQPARPTGGRAG